MRTRLCALSLCLVLTWHTGAAAQWAVHDAPAFARDAAQWVEEAAQWAHSIASEVKQVEAQYNIIIRQIEQTETMIRNLQRIPEGLNFLEVITVMGNKVTALLNGATIMSYDVERVVGQFDSLYQQVGVLSNPQEVLAWRQRLLNGRMEASQVTVQVTAIKAQLTELYTRICALLSGSWTAQGNLDIQQIQAQQNGFIQHTLETIAAMQAAHARNTAQYQAEQAALERVQLQAIQGAMGSAAPLGTPQGTLPRFHW